MHVTIVAFGINTCECKEYSYLLISEYNVTSNTAYLNHETLERDCHFWDALECSKWLPLMALNLPPSGKNESSFENSIQFMIAEHIRCS